MWGIFTGSILFILGLIFLFPIGWLIAAAGMTLALASTARFRSVGRQSAKPAASRTKRGSPFHEVDASHCPACGANLEPEDSVCPSCGINFGRPLAEREPSAI